MSSKNTELADKYLNRLIILFNVFYRLDHPDLNRSDYKGEFSTVIISYIYDMRDVLIHWFINHHKSDIERLLANLHKLYVFLFKQYKSVINKLQLKDYRLNYNNDSLSSVLAHNQSFYNNLLSDFNPSLYS